MGGAAAVAGMRRCLGDSSCCSGRRNEEAAATMCGAATLAAATATAIRRCPESGFSLRWPRRQGKRQRASAALSSGGRGWQASPLR
ncbi:hypothetical protein NDU88_004788 [Pleurodeles waltl]|uniref:Uncharacterized protein n=1 Tax=Pleurodeles waltl TaxID=8319 RepID=A0AAV7UGR0_PLEWA|nr:hypothetical protein NDU88_004788 [Pleurodeles waltl]